MKVFWTNKKGISLVEVVVAVALVVIATLAILAAVTQSISFTETADKIYTSSILAQKRIDLLKNFVFNDIPTSAPETDTHIDVDADSTTDYMRTTTITENFDGYSNLIHIKVSVDRVIDGEKSGHPVVMETVFADINE